MSEENNLANPAPLGLMGFGMTTVLLNIHNTGFIALGSMIFAMGIFYGALAQLIAGWWEMKQGNTFAAVAFSSFGLFWLSLVAIFFIPEIVSSEFAPTADGLAMYLAMWGLFTTWMFLSTLKFNRALQFVFASLAVLFFMLALGEYNSTIATLAGFEGIICGFSAVYTAMAEVTNEYYGKTIFPIGPME